MSTRIALVHALTMSMSPVAEAFARGWPDAEIVNLLDDSLSRDRATMDSLTPSMMQRFASLLEYAVDIGADGVLFACSAFGPAIEAARSATQLPVLKPNEAMFETALGRGPRIGLLATFEPSLAPMKEEFDAMAAARGLTLTLQTHCVPEAMQALRDGDEDTHIRLVSEGAGVLEHCQCIMLAQFSMAPAAEAVRAKVSCPVLTSPDAAVARLRQLLA
jgi:Asp/Glu/hydantoin racemase